MVDCGAYNNTMGRTFADLAARQAIKGGYTPKEFPLKEKICVNGIGHGHFECHNHAKIPVCLTDTESNRIKGDWNSIIAEGDGSHTPALFGLTSMEQQRCIINTDPQDPYIAFPGEGKTEIEWSPGTTLIRLEKGVSGHLFMPIDGLKKLPQKRGGLPEHTISLPTNTVQPQHLNEDLIRCHHPPEL